MARIPAPLQNPDFRFVKILRSEKNPIEKRWQTDNNYRHDDLEMEEWLDNKGTTAWYVAVGTWL